MAVCFALASSGGAANETGAGWESAGSAAAGRLLARWFSLIGAGFDSAAGDIAATTLFEETGAGFAGLSSCFAITAVPALVRDAGAGLGFALIKLCPNTVIPYTETASSATTPATPANRIHLPLGLGDGELEDGGTGSGGAVCGRWFCCSAGVARSKGAQACETGSDGVGVAKTVGTDAATSSILSGCLSASLNSSTD